MRPWRALAGALVLSCLPGWAPGSGAEPVVERMGHGPPVRLLVVPFETDASSARTFWLGEGAALLVGDELRGVGWAVVHRRHRVQALEELRLPESTPLSHATAIRLGQMLGVDALVIGSVEVVEGELTARASLVAIEAGRRLAEVVESGEVTEFDAVCRRLAIALGESAAELGVAARPVGPAEPSVPLEALEAYVKGLLSPTAAPRRQLLDAALARHPAYDRARLALWDANRELGEHDAALAIVEAVATEAPSARRARFAAAVSLIELRRHDEAFDRLRALLDEAPAATVFNNLGVVQLRRGATPTTGSATYYFTKATETNPDDATHHFNLGYAYAIERDAPAAVYWLREAVRRQPSDADAHFVLGWALASMGSSAEASRALELARRLSARYERSTATDLPRGLERLSPELDPWLALRFDASVTRAVQRDQEDLADFHLERARRLFESRQDAEAIGEVRRALYLSPYAADAHLLLGRLYLRADRLDDAIDALRIAAWSDETPDVLVALAEALIEAGDLMGAREAVDRALALDPRDAAAAALKAQMSGETPR